MGYGKNGGSHFGHVFAAEDCRHWTLLVLSPVELWGDLKVLRLCQFETGFFIVAEEVVIRFKCVSIVLRH